MDDAVIRFTPEMAEDPYFSKSMAALEILKEAHAMELRDEREHLLMISEVIETLYNDLLNFLLVQELISGLCAQSDVGASVMVTALEERGLGAKGSRSQMDLSVIMPKGKRTPRESAPKHKIEPTPVTRERRVKAAKAKPDPRAKELEKVLKMLETKVFGLINHLIPVILTFFQKHQLAAARALLTKGKKVTPASKQSLREDKEGDAIEPERTGPVRRGVVCAEPVRRERVRAKPVHEEPVHEEPVDEEPVREEPADEEPVLVRRGHREPVVEAPVVDRRKANVPVVQEQTSSQPGLFTFQQVQELLLLRQPPQQPAVMLPSQYGQMDPYHQPYLEQEPAIFRHPYAPLQFAPPLTRAPAPFDMPRIATGSVQHRGLFQPSPSHRQADSRHLQQQLFAQNEARACYTFLQHPNPFSAPTRPRSVQGYTGYLESPAPRQHFMDEYQY